MKICKSTRAFSLILGIGFLTTFGSAGKFESEIQFFDIHPTLADMSNKLSVDMLKLKAYAQFCLNIDCDTVIKEAKENAQMDLQIDRMTEGILSDDLRRELRGMLLSNINYSAQTNDTEDDSKINLPIEKIVAGILNDDPRRNYSETLCILNSFMAQKTGKALYKERLDRYESMVYTEQCINNLRDGKFRRDYNSVVASARFAKILAADKQWQKDRSNLREHLDQLDFTNLKDIEQFINELHAFYLHLHTIYIKSKAEFIPGLEHFNNTSNIFIFEKLKDNIGKQISQTETTSQGMSFNYFIDPTYQIDISGELKKLRSISAENISSLQKEFVVYNRLNHDTSYSSNGHFTDYKKAVSSFQSGEFNLENAVLSDAIVLIEGKDDLFKSRYNKLNFTRGARNLNICLSQIFNMKSGEKHVERANYTTTNEHIIAKLFSNYFKLAKGNYRIEHDSASRYALTDTSKLFQDNNIYEEQILEFIRWMSSPYSVINIGQTIGSITEEPVHVITFLTPYPNGHAKYGQIAGLIFVLHDDFFYYASRVAEDLRNQETSKPRLQSASTTTNPISDFLSSIEDGTGPTSIRSPLAPTKTIVNELEAIHYNTGRISTKRYCSEEDYILNSNYNTDNH